LITFQKLIFKTKSSTTVVEFMCYEAGSDQRLTVRKLIFLKGSSEFKGAIVFLFEWPFVAFPE